MMTGKKVKSVKKWEHQEDDLSRQFSAMSINDSISAKHGGGWGEKVKKIPSKIGLWFVENVFLSKMDIMNTTVYIDLLNENKRQKARIQQLERKYLKARPRKQYKDPYVIYIIASEEMVRNNRYKIGKTKNLTSRLGDYNTIGRHYVLFYQACETQRKMNLMEQLVHLKLDAYREEAAHEWFILPEGKTIDFFKDAIRNSWKAISF